MKQTQRILIQIVMHRRTSQQRLKQRSAVPQKCKELQGGPFWWQVTMELLWKRTRNSGLLGSAVCIKFFFLPSFHSLFFVCLFVLCFSRQGFSV